MNLSDTYDTRALLFAGGRLGEWALSLIRPGDYLIGADRGAEFLVDRGFRPDLSLGDFDSASPESLDRIKQASVEMIACDPIDKDWTDTELALREAVLRGRNHIVIVGALGGRFDHALANVHLLRQALELGCEAVIVDEHNEIRLCSGSTELEADDRYPYVSLLPLTEFVQGVTLEGFLYPLDDATLKLGWSLGISNVVMQPKATVNLSAGLLLVIRSRD